MLGLLKISVCHSKYAAYCFSLHTMKKTMLLMVLLFSFGCNSGDGSDCFKKQGELTEKQIHAAGSDKIQISQGIELVVKQSDTYSVKVECGKNFIDDIVFSVFEGELIIRNESSCGLLRNYHSAKVVVSTPELKKIYSASQYAVRSQGVLNFPELTLESGGNEGGHPAALFEIQVDNEQLKISDNASSVFKIKGQTKNLDIRFWSGAARFEGGELISEEVHFYHRSSNDIIVSPLELVKGTLAGTGNLVLIQVPANIDVEQLYTGHIVYP